MPDPSGESPQGKVLDAGYFDGPVFSDLLGALLRKRLTGMLVLARGKAQKRISLIDGVPRWSTSNLQSEVGILDKQKPEAEQTRQLERLIGAAFTWTGGTFQVIQGPALADQVARSPDLRA